MSQHPYFTHASHAVPHLKTEEPYNIK